MKSVLLGAALSLALVGQAAAGDWRFVGIGDTFAAGIDFSRLTRSGNVARAWVINSGTTRYQLFLADFDCDAMTTTVLNSAVYDNAGNLLRANAARGSTLPVVPDSVGDSTLRAACENKPSHLAGLDDPFDRARDFHDNTGRVLFD